MCNNDCTDCQWNWRKSVWRCCENRFFYESAWGPSWPIKAGFQREGHNFCDPTIRILIRTGVPFDLTSTVADERSLCGSSNLATFYCHIQHHIPPCQKVVHLYSENYPFLVPKFFGFFWLAGEFSYSKRELVMLYFTFGGCPSSPVQSLPPLGSKLMFFRLNVIE